MVNIYIGNLSFDATEDDVREAFEAYGSVNSVSIIKDRDTGRSRGFAFVEMADRNEADAAIENLNQKEIQGRTVNVNETRPRSERDGGGRGGRGGHGGGRGGGGGRRW